MSLSYGLATGRLNIREGVGVFGGAPKASKMAGVVRVFQYSRKDKTFKMKDVLESPDDQIGSYFGSVICSVDLNSDGKVMYNLFTPNIIIKIPAD